MSPDYSENKPADASRKTLLNWEEQLCKQIRTEWEKGKTYVDDLNVMYDDIYAMLHGERPKKDYDWQSNVVINKVFQAVSTAIPYLTQKIFGATPIIGVKSYNQQGSWERQEILEFWHTMQAPPGTNHTPYFSVIVMWVLRALLNGVGIMKKTWNQKLKTETETRQVDIPLQDETGANVQTELHTIEIEHTFPVEDWPLNTPINNKDIVFDWNLKPGESISRGRFVIHREMVDLDFLYRSGLYMNLGEINPKLNTTDSETRKAHEVPGQENVPDSDIYADIEVYERVGILPVKETKGGYEPVFDKDDIYGNDDIEMINMIATVARLGSSGEQKDILIRFEPNPYECINYIDVHIFLDSERWNSIGLIEPIKDLQVAVNDNINAMFDEIWQNLMPPVIVNKFALWDWDTMVYAPHQRWLVGGSPADSIHFKEPSNITRDAWQKHALLDNEIQVSTVTNSMQGMGREKTATTNVLNAQMTAGKLDFILKMIEVTGLIPSAQMDVKFAKMFAHPLTFQTILGSQFQYSDWEETYKYIPAAASVKLEHQKETEIMQDIQLMQIVGSMQNPNVPKIMNVIWGNILRNRNMPKEAGFFDENFFEPASEAGNMQMLRRMLGGGAMGGGGQVPQNQNALPMSGQEQSVRRGTHQPRGM